MLLNHQGMLSDGEVNPGMKMLSGLPMAGRPYLFPMQMRC